MMVAMVLLLPLGDRASVSRPWEHNPAGLESLARGSLVGWGPASGLDRPWNRPRTNPLSRRDINLRSEYFSNACNSAGVVK